MRISLVGPAHPLKGGVAQHTVALATRLREAGHDVDIQSWARQYPARLYPGEQEVTGAPELEGAPPIHPALAWDRPYSWARVAQGLRDRDLVVFAHVTPVQVLPYWTMLATLRRSRTPSVVICHNVLPHERSRWDRFLVSRLLRQADRVITHTQAEAAVARTLTSKPVSVAPLAPFMPAAFTAVPAARTVHRRLLFFGLVRPYKGLDVLIRALAQGPPDIQLRVAGEFWGGTSDSRRLVDQLGLTDRVELLPGYVPAADVPNLFEDVDALVLPYRSATGSQGVAVGFQFGVPVLVTRAGELAAGVSEGVDGLVAEPDDVGSLARVLWTFYAEGTPEALRSQVRREEQRQPWADYVGTLLGDMNPDDPGAPHVRGRE